LKSKLFVALVVLCISGFAFAQTEQEKMADDPMMKAWEAYMTPGDAHKTMAGMVGSWETVITNYMDPAQPAEEKGSSVFSMEMGGRYIIEKAEGNFMGMPFQGMGVHGYDNALKKYVSTWIDNMGTGIMTSTGSSTDGGKTINFSGMNVDPMSGKEQGHRSVMHMMSADQYHFEMYGPGMDGKEMKLFEITYNRKK